MWGQKWGTSNVSFQIITKPFRPLAWQPGGIVGDELERPVLLTSWVTLGKIHNLSEDRMRSHTREFCILRYKGGQTKMAAQRSDAG